MQFKILIKKAVPKVCAICGARVPKACAIYGTRIPKYVKHVPYMAHEFLMYVPRMAHEFLKSPKHKYDVKNQKLRIFMVKMLLGP